MSTSAGDPLQTHARNFVRKGGGEKWPDRRTSVDSPNSTAASAEASTTLTSIAAGANDLDCFPPRLEPVAARCSQYLGRREARRRQCLLLDDREQLTLERAVIARRPPQAYEYLPIHPPRLVRRQIALAHPSRHLRHDLGDIASHRPQCVTPDQLARARQSPAFELVESRAQGRALPRSQIATWCANASRSAEPDVAPRCTRATSTPA